MTASECAYLRCDCPLLAGAALGGCWTGDSLPSTPKPLLRDVRRLRLMRMQPIGVPKLQVCDWQWAAEQKALNLIRVPGFEVLPLRFGFHAFGDRRQRQASRHGDDGIDQRRVAAGGRSDVAHECPVDLECVDRKMPQVRQR